METIMNDNDSKAFLKEMARLYPKYKENFGAVSNLIVLLVEEIAEKREERDKYKQMWEELKERYPSLVLNYISSNAKILLTQARVLRIVEMKALKQKYFPKECD